MNSCLSKGMHCGFSFVMVSCFGALITRWIAWIRLFDFEVRHVKGVTHTAADGLSRRPRVPGDTSEDEDGDIDECIYEQSNTVDENAATAPINFAPSTKPALLTANAVRIIQGMTSDEFHAIVKAETANEVEQVGVCNTEEVFTQVDKGQRTHHDRETLPIVRVCLNGYGPIKAIPDSGATISIISEKLALQSNLPIRPMKRYAVGISPETTILTGICEKVKVTMGGAQVTTDIWVLRNVQNSLLLGIPWFRKGEVTFAYQNRSQFLSVMDELEGDKAYVWYRCKPITRQFDETYDNTCKDISGN